MTTPPPLEFLPESLLVQTLQGITPVGHELDAALAGRLDSLTKPPGSLGRLEGMALHIGRIQRSLKPSVGRKVVLVFAADHGVAAEGVSAYPAEVTPQMVLNFLSGGAAVNVLARHAGARVVVADVGVNHDFPPPPRGPLAHKVARGTRSITRGPAMSRDDARRALEAGIRVAVCEIGAGAELVAVGDMGIGNTTSSAAITACLTGHAPAAVTGRGTGVDDAALALKVRAVEQALEVNALSGGPNGIAPAAPDALGVLAAVGGFEIGAIAGAILGAARHRVPVLVDGYIATAGALIAHALCPASAEYMLAGHRSAEPGHRIALQHLLLSPYLELEMRLGEGSGAVLAMHLAEAATRILAEMATFEGARVSGREGA